MLLFQLLFMCCWFGLTSFARERIGRLCSNEAGWATEVTALWRKRKQNSLGINRKAFGLIMASENANSEAGCVWNTVRGGLLSFIYLASSSTSVELWYLCSRWWSLTSMRDGLSWMCPRHHLCSTTPEQSLRLAIMDCFDSGDAWLSQNTAKSCFS